MTVPLRWLYFDLNSYFASVEQQEQPALRGKPVGVVPMLNVASTCCLAASYEAKAFGVKTGTIVAEARLMCPGIRFVAARPEMYVKYHHMILEAVESCLPIDSVLSIDEMAGRLRGSEQNVDEAKRLALRVKATVAKRVGAYLKSSIGLAPNRWLAKVAGDMQKPDGLTVLEHKDLPQALFKLELQDLPGIGRNMERRLLEKGIRTVEQLCALNNSRMREVWNGIVGERFAAWLKGEDVDSPHEHNKSLGHSHVLEPELRTKVGAYQVAKDLTAKAAVRLRRIEHWAGGFSLAVRLKDQDTWHRYAKLPELQDTPTFLTLLKKFWLELPENSKPMWIGVTMVPLVASERHIASLFDDGRKEKLSRVMDAINTRYGKETATYASLFDTEDKAPTRIPFSRVPDLSEF